MCNKFCLEFIKKNLSEKNILNKTVLEVGSLDVNGSPRSIVMELGPSEYVGVDIAAGAGVDLLCRAEDLLEKFGQDKFDVLISMEMLEHVKNWQEVIHNIKNVIKPNGLLVLTTRSKGAGYHGYPYDFWRYGKEDFEFIFSDFIIERLEKEWGGYGCLSRLEGLPVLLKKN